jgi:hypothetical protein
MRPRYESEENLQDQRDVAVALALLWSMEPIEVLGNEAWDYELWRASPRYRVEIKCRRIGPFPELMISEHKWDRLVAADSIDVRSLLVVRWPDRSIWGVRADGTDDFRRAEAGRTVQTRDRWDAERCVFVPMSAMKLIWRP